MSQHIFQTKVGESPVSILMGYDRPLRGFFLVIEEMDCEDDTYVYDNLSDPELVEYGGLPPTLEVFDAKLKELGIAIPERMRSEILADQAGNVGNRVVVYDAAGNIERDSASRAQGVS